jgi:hypothetical protein
MTQLTKVIICILFAVIVNFTLPLISLANNEKIEELENKVTELTRRLEQLEPDKPKNIYHSEFHPPFPSNTDSIEEVIKTGEEIPFQVGIDNPKWERPIYDEYWHSLFWGGRFSYVPDNLHNAMHRMFIGFQSVGQWFGLTHTLGIYEELQEVTNPKAFSEKKVNEKMVIVIMQAEVKKIIKKENQLVLISEPKRTGLQVITVMYTDALPSSNEVTLLQLVTPDGYEYDYTLFRPF